MITSKTYQIPGDIELFFTDSGAPSGSTDYTTLVVFHGTAFHGACFKQIHEHAHAFNLRTVVVNRRDYPGSSKFTSSDIKEIEDGREEFIHGLGVQTAEFLKQLIERERIPQMSASADGQGMRGGIAIMGWSFGCVTAMSLFTAPNLISQELYSLLEDHVRDIVLYDPVYLGFGYELPDDNANYIPFLDFPNIDPEIIPKALAAWVSSYYDHKSLAVTATIHDLDGIRKSTNEMTVGEWTETEFNEYMYMDSAGEVPMYLPPMQKSLRALTNAFLFDEKTWQACFPKMKVTYIGATRTNWMSAWCEIETRKRYQQNGYQGRHIKFLDMQGANHFVHMDRPQEFMERVVTGISA